MQTSIDRERLLDAYRDAGSSPGAATTVLAVVFVVLCVAAATGVSLDRGEAAIGHEAAKGRLEVEQPSIAHARNVYAARREAHARAHGELRIAARN